jgi:hypothetical protein
MQVLPLLRRGQIGNIINNSLNYNTKEIAFHAHN